MRSTLLTVSTRQQRQSRPRDVQCRLPAYLAESASQKSVLVKCKKLVTLADMCYSVTVVDHRAQHVLLCIEQNASTTKTATIAEKVH
jgi:hypothetical protein